MEPNPDRHVTTATIDDAEHFSEEERGPHHRELCGMGSATPERRAFRLGSGRIFPISELTSLSRRSKSRRIGLRLPGLDFGWDHPTAAAKLAWDRDNDVIYVTADYRRSQQTPIMHCGALKPWGKGLVWAWPHDGLQAR